MIILLVHIPMTAKQLETDQLSGSHNLLNRKGTELTIITFLVLILYSPVAPLWQHTKKLLMQTHFCIFMQYRILLLMQTYFPIYALQNFVGTED